MSVDLSQFHQVFFEESYEGLDAMENGLLNMDMDDIDSEVINTIFRSAHSIKGGAGTFGFNQITGFTHVVETVLDEIRGGDRKMDQSLLDILLASVDCLRGLLQDLQSGDEPEMDTANELKAKFEAILSGQTEGSAPSSNGASDSGNSQSGNEDQNGSTPDGGGEGWFIRFIPEPQLLQSGNEPVRMFRQLEEVSEGKMDVKVFHDKMPTLSAMNPEHCYLSWEITIKKNVDRAQIDEVFEWVIDDAEVHIEPLVGTTLTEEPAPASPAEVEKPSDPVTSAAKEKVPEKVDTKAAKKLPSSPQTQESSSIRVSIDKVDSLINMVGELVITQSMLGQLGQNFDISRIQRLQEGLAQLEHNTRELQESVMKIRMMPISFVFSRFPRLVRDTSRILNKKIELVMSGESTELDKTVMEKIGDPLVHLIRNSMDHGIETPDKRVANGKSETGTVKLTAYHQSGNIVIEIKDDGAGLNKEKILSKAIENGLITEDQTLTDEQVHDLIFQPGFSTADQVSDLSGRGVGMDVVRRNISALNGTVEVESFPGKGSSFIIRLPLTLAILDGQLVSVGDQTFIFPLVSIVESIQLEGRDLNNVGGYSDVLLLRDEYVPIIPLSGTFNLNVESKTLEESIIVVVETEGEKIGVVVDELMGQQQVVIKSLEENYKRIEGISGATILGDGTVALIIDISGLAKMAGVSIKHLDASTIAA